MTLSEIAAGVETVTEQRQRSVGSVDATGRSLDERFGESAASLPCAPSTAATVVEAYARGADLETAAADAAVTPVTAARVLYRCGVTSVVQLSASDRRTVREWLAGERSRTAVLESVDCDPAEFTLAGYVETHDPDPDLVAATAELFAGGGDATVQKRDRLAETMSSPAELR
ncbi:MAG: hypothetical protein ABEH80_10940 [Halobaculum sp.]|mgnify:CR=1 FL=1